MHRRKRDAHEECDGCACFSRSRRMVLYDCSPALCARYQCPPHPPTTCILATLLIEIMHSAHTQLRSCGCRAHNTSEQPWMNPNATAAAAISSPPLPTAAA